MKGTPSRQATPQPDLRRRLAPRLRPGEVKFPEENPATRGERKGERGPAVEHPASRHRAREVRLVTTRGHGVQEPAALIPKFILLRGAKCTVPSRWTSSALELSERTRPTIFIVRLRKQSNGWLSRCPLEGASLCAPPDAATVRANRAGRRLQAIAALDQLETTVDSGASLKYSESSSPSFWCLRSVHSGTDSRCLRFAMWVSGAAATSQRGHGGSSSAAAGSCGV